MIKKEEVISFVWQHILLFVSLYVMTFGVAACVRSQLGSSVISTIPYVMASAGKMLDYIPGWTIGGYTIMMNAIFVVLQILILRRNFEWVQLFQLAIGFIFGMFIDLQYGAYTVDGFRIYPGQCPCADCRLHHPRFRNCHGGEVRLSNHAWRGHFHRHSQGYRLAFP